jgi:hypothetical protein
MEKLNKNENFFQKKMKIHHRQLEVNQKTFICLNLNDLKKIKTFHETYILIGTENKY